ncbi:MAG: Bug family tripartite tricarboxylate transporter substrate binding protein [Reyranella sp.]|uniref:Bug family tripartite tricarboxylate transporter substrate binding protein n=1 Tax=Reyranella sp. TaxID=1929291 RepID=UPI003D12E3C2
MLLLLAHEGEAHRHLAHRRHDVEAGSRVLGTAQDFDDDLPDGLAGLQRQPQNAKCDPLADFTPITLVGQSPLILVVPASKPFMTVKDLDAYLKASGSRATYASSGPAGITQFGAEVYLKRAGDLSAVHVSYRGGAPMMEALAKGEADFGVAVLA